jgi:hypothetical protein
MLMPQPVLRTHIYPARAAALLPLADERPTLATQRHWQLPQQQRPAQEK